MLELLSFLKRRPEVTAVATDASASASASASEPTPAPVEAQAGWVERRAPQRDTDRSLTSATHHWLHTVPSGVHPKRLCRMHPRIANRIALAWADVDQTEKLFEELLQDKRGGRRGFPPIVLNELRRLRDLHRNRSGVAFYRVRRR